MSDCYFVALLLGGGGGGQVKSACMSVWCGWWHIGVKGNLGSRPSSSTSSFAAPHKNAGLRGYGGVRKEEVEGLGIEAK